MYLLLEFLVINYKAIIYQPFDVLIKQKNIKTFFVLRWLFNIVQMSLAIWNKMN